MTLLLGRLILTQSAQISLTNAAPRLRGAADCTSAAPTANENKYRQSISFKQTHCTPTPVQYRIRLCVVFHPAEQIRLADGEARDAAESIISHCLRAQPAASYIRLTHDTN